MTAITAFGFILVLGDGFGARRAPSGMAFDGIANFEELLAGNTGLHRDCDAGQFTTSEQCRTSDSPVMALWGDSFAMHLAQALKYSPSAMPLVQLTLSQCSPVPDMALNGSVLNWKTCIEFNDNVLKWILAQESIRIVVISSPFDQLKKNQHLYARNGEEMHSPLDRKAAIVGRISDLAAQLAADGKRLVVVSPMPRTGLDLGLCWVRNRLMGKEDGACDFPVSAHHSYSMESIELLSAVAGIVPVIWLERFVCDHETCKVTIEGDPLYRDIGHLSITGSTKLGGVFDLAGVIRNVQKVDIGWVGPHGKGVSHTDSIR